MLRLRPSRAVLPAVLLAALVAASGGPAAVTGDPAPPASAATAPFVRVLGTAQDGGLPHAACSCERCRLARADPRHRRGVASLAIVAPPTVFLVDATPDLPAQLAALADVRNAPAGRVDRQPIDGVLLSHAHMGHYLGLAWLGYEAVHTSGLPVWTSPRMAGFLRSNQPWRHLVDRGEIELRPLAPGTTIALTARVRVTALAVPHRDEDSDTLGFRITGPRRTLLYVPDTDAWERWQPPLTEALEGVDVALLDGTFYSLDELPGRDVASIPHPLVVRSMELLEPLVRDGLEVYFTHMNHSNPALTVDGPERRELESRGFRLAADGQEIGL